LNNLLRSELFFKSQTVFDQAPTQVLFYIVKSGMFPASQSTLYYEQARNQLTPLAQNGVFDIPIRLVGLLSPLNQKIPVELVGYSGRTSRTVNQRKQITGIIQPRTGKRRRPQLTILEDDRPVAEAEAESGRDSDSTPSSF
jgi:hypothetical protein